jgi:hypothetical protein
LDSDEDSEAEDAGNATIYVSGLRKETTKDAVTLFFENKKRSGGGELCEGPGEEGYKRVSPTVACLTFVSSKGAVNSLILFLHSGTNHLISLSFPFLTNVVYNLHIKL